MQNSDYSHFQRCGRCSDDIIWALTEFQLYYVGLRMSVNLIYVERNLDFREFIQTLVRFSDLSPLSHEASSAMNIIYM